MARHRPVRQTMAEAERRLLIPRPVRIAVLVILCSAGALGAGICFLAIDGTVALWLFGGGAVLGVVGIVLAVRYRIAARTAAEEQRRTRDDRYQ